MQNSDSLRHLAPKKTISPWLNDDGPDGPDWLRSYAPPATTVLDRPFDAARHSGGTQSFGPTTKSVDDVVKRRRKNAAREERERKTMHTTAALISSTDPYVRQQGYFNQVLLDDDIKVFDQI